MTDKQCSLNRKIIIKRRISERRTVCYHGTASKYSEICIGRCCYRSPMPVLARCMTLIISVCPAGTAPKLPRRHVIVNTIPVGHCDENFWYNINNVVLDLIYYHFLNCLSKFYIWIHKHASYTLPRCYNFYLGKSFWQ